MENQDHTEFLKEYNEATKAVCEKHDKELVPVFRFGEQWIPAQLMVNVRSSDEKEETTTDSDSGDADAKE